MVIIIRLNYNILHFFLLAKLLIKLGYSKIGINVLASGSAWDHMIT